MMGTLAISALASLSLVAEAAPLRRMRRSTPVKRLSWTLTENYIGESFLDGWSFFTDPDPTHGQVSYVQDETLAYHDQATNTTMIKVDSSTDLGAGEARRSTRIVSNAVVNENSLVIGSFLHAPSGCGTWPAFWLVGPDWPSGGEIDIFENVNLAEANAMTLHTGPGCTHDPNGGEQTGTSGELNCDANVAGNIGCGVTDNSGLSYGQAFNDNRGGVFAMQWDSEGISVWFFPRPNVPRDIKTNKPNPSGWGTPTAFFAFTTCDSSFFKDMQAVINISLCGDWAGQPDVYGQTCSGTCSDQIMTGSNFEEAYFQIRKVQFYQGA